MAWTTPTDRTTGYTVTASDWNVVQDDLSFLYGDTGWTTVGSFTNSWGTSNSVKYILLGRVVYIQGTLTTAGTANTTAFTLPAGYRPSTGTLAWVCASGALGTTQSNLTINTSGAVNPVTSTPYFINLSFSVV